MRSLRWVALAALALVAGCTPQADREVLYQTCTVSALQEGVYDGEMTLAEVAAHGNLGLGTFNALDGEMVVVDGTVYQVRADGKVYRPPPEARTPFAAVTHFEADRWADADGPIGYADLKVLVDRIAGVRNVPLAVRIDGRFRYVKTRSVPRQTKPYPRLAEVAKRQPTFEFRDVAGTLVGFRLPPFVEGLNVPGYHLHFLTDDRSAGGHVLDVTVEAVTIAVDVTPALHVALPTGGAFTEVDLGRDTAGELRRIE